MKLVHGARRVLKKIGAYKYAALILLLGVGLMLIPQEEKTSPEMPEPTVAAEGELESRLEEVLVQMDGVGKVQVLLTLATGTSYQYQTDSTTHTKQEEAEVSRQTVLASDGGGKQMPITTKVIYPTYQGALVLCQGADRAAVKLSVMQAVSALTGLSSDRISVIKMKGD